MSINDFIQLKGAAMQTILGACIGLCAVFACMAQVVGITGVVTDTGNTIIPGAFVKLEKTGLLRSLPFRPFRADTVTTMGITTASAFMVYGGVRRSSMQ